MVSHHCLDDDITKTQSWDCSSLVSLKCIFWIFKSHIALKTENSVSFQEIYKWHSSHYQPFTMLTFGLWDWGEKAVSCDFPFLECSFKFKEPTELTYNEIKTWANFLMYSCFTGLIQAYILVQTYWCHDQVIVRQNKTVYVQSQIIPRMTCKIAYTSLHYAIKSWPG